MSRLLGRMGLEVERSDWPSVLQNIVMPSAGYSLWGTGARSAAGAFWKAACTSAA